MNGNSLWWKEIPGGPIAFRRRIPWTPVVRKIVRDHNQDRFSKEVLNVTCGAT